MVKLYDSVYNTTVYNKLNNINVFFRHNAYMYVQQNV